MDDAVQTYQRDIQDYLDATGEAAKRTRTATIVLVIATVLVFSGLLNSQQTNWMHRRLAKLQDIHSGYAESKLGPYPKPGQNENDEAAYKKAVEAYEHRYYDLWSAVVRTYVETSWVVRVPFFGFSFDVNDLGLLGGIGLLAILVCYRFCLTREVNNLRLSFEEARKISPSEFQEFYKLLAMRQVFTVPRTHYIQRSKFLIITPKIICWFTVMVYLAVAFNDASTAFIGHELEDARLRFLIAFEIIASVLLILLAIGATKRLLRMDEIWDSCWDEIQKGPTPLDVVSNQIPAVSGQP